MINGDRGKAIPGTVTPVVLSTNRPRFSSTTRPSGAKNPLLKIHWNLRRNPTFEVTDFSPNVGIGEWFTPCSCIEAGVHFSRTSFTGMTLTSAPVSSRKRIPVVWSLT